MALYVIKDPFINDSDSAEVKATKWQLAHAEEEQIRQSLRTDFQFGEMAFSYLLNCPFFDYMVLRTRTVIRRENCHPGCIDQSDPDDPNKYDRRETVHSEWQKLLQVMKGSRRNPLTPGRWDHM